MKINEIVDALGEQLLKSINMEDRVEKSVSGITSMYQDIEPGRLFMLKKSATSEHYFDDRKMSVVYVEDVTKAANKKR